MTTYFIKVNISKYDKTVPKQKRILPISIKFNNKFENFLELRVRRVLVGIFHRDWRIKLH